MFANCRRWLLTILCFLGVGIVGWVYLSSMPLPKIQAEEPQAQASQSQQDDVADDAQKESADDSDVASRIVGETQCMDCHRAEFRRWKSSKHATRAYDLLRTSASSRRYAEALDIEFSEVTAPSSLCVECHGTRQTLATGETRVLSSITCESCHNASGGERGWLNAHAVYGKQGSSRAAETKEHYQARREKCGKAGQLRSEDLYQLAKTCFSCHVVGNEALVNDGGHPQATQNFDLAGKSLGEVRHNFHLDQKVNAEVATLWLDPLWNGKERNGAGRKRLMFVVGAMVDLEVSLRHLTETKDEDGDFYENMSDRVVSAYELLQEDILEVVEEEEEEEDEEDEEEEEEEKEEEDENDEEGLPLLTDLLEALEEIYEKLDEEELVLEDDRQSCIDAANAVSRAAIAFVAKHNGNRLTALDEPEVPDDE